MEKRNEYGSNDSFLSLLPLFYAGSIYSGILIFISYMVYFPPKTNLFIRCTVAWIIGPDIKTVIIVQIPKLPPNKTPITTALVNKNWTQN